MRSPRRAHGRAWALVVACLATASCQAILGLDEGHPREEGPGSGAAGTGGGGTGGAAGCLDAAVDCPAPGNPCLAAICADGACSTEPVPADTPLEQQTEGDCEIEICDGSGSASTTPEAPGTECSQGDGKTCNGLGDCVECLSPADCPDMAPCVLQACVPETCRDDTLNGDETAVDCGGGTCPGCGDGLLCNEDGDCAGGACKLGTPNACCTPEPPAPLCAGKCGTVVDNCGKDVTCSMCTLPLTCGGGAPGTANVCGCTPPCPHWQKTFGNPGDSQIVEGVAVSASGQVAMVGAFQGTVDFGGGALTSVGSDDIFVAVYDAAGNHVYSSQFGDGEAQHARAVAFDASGNLYVTGSFSGGVTFGGPIFSAPFEDVFVVKLDATGGHLWSNAYGSSGDQYGFAIATDASHVWVVGGFASTLDFGGGTLTAVDTDVFVAKLDQTNGSHVASARYGGNGTDIAFSVASDSTGGVVVSGYFDEAVDFGCGPMTAALGAPRDTFVTRLTSTLGCTYGHDFESVLYGVSRVAVDSGANAVIGGVFATSIVIGTTTHTSVGGKDAFLARIDPSGAFLYTGTFGAMGDDAITAVDTDGTHVFVTGEQSGGIDFGGGPLPSQGIEDAFLAKITVAGTHVWSRSYGDSAFQGGTAIDLGATSLAWGASFWGAIDAGLGPLNAAGFGDALLVTFDP